MAGVEQCEPFTLDDGRHGVVLGMTVAVDLATLDFDPRSYLPQLDPDALGAFTRSRTHEHPRETATPCPS